MPYAVIPLTVIALDMIVATLPLAVLLVEMMVQSLSPSVTVDPLLAKNVLWFFGHPVVYLLLFPTVALYYLLIPRFAGRALVAGNVIAIGWAIAVIANVIVWAHHIYIDYPSGSPQAALNIAMEPLTLLGDDRLGALALQPLLHDVPLAVHLERRLDGALPRTRELAARRPLGRGQRDDRVRRRSSTTRSGSSATSTRWRSSRIGLGIIGATYAFLPDARRASRSTARRWRAGTSG